MKNFKLSVKIGLGFGLLIVIALALGGLAALKMNSTAEDSTMLADEYVPEVVIAAGIRGAANRVMYEMRGYGFTEDEVYYKQAGKEMAAMEAGLAQGEKLAAQAVHLKELHHQLERIKKAEAEYRTAAEKTAATVKQLEDERSRLDLNAIKYITNSDQFLAGQNESTKKDLNRRQKKIALVTSVAGLGTQVRVTNFKAQSSGDMKLMQQAIDALTGLKQFTDQLRPITNDKEDIQRIEDIEAAAEKYAANMAAYIKAEEEMKAAGWDMSSENDRYLKNCNAFLTSQNKRMQQEIARSEGNLNERLTKINLVTHLIAIGNEAQTTNLKGRTNQDSELMKKAADHLKQVGGILDQLRPITRNQDNIRQIEVVDKAAGNYITAINKIRRSFPLPEQLSPPNGRFGRTVRRPVRHLPERPTEESLPAI